MFKTELLSTYENYGWFNNYPENHLLKVAIKTMQLDNFDEIKIDYSNKENNSKFIENFEKIITSISKYFDKQDMQLIITNYLRGYDKYYSDEIFWIRVSTLCFIHFVIQVKGAKTCQSISVDEELNEFVFSISYGEDRTINICSDYFDAQIESKALVNSNYIDLYVGLTELKLKELKNVLKELKIDLIPPRTNKLQEILQRNNQYFNSMNNDTNILLLPVKASCMNSIDVIEGLLTNSVSGFFVNDNLRNENNIEVKNISEVFSFIISNRVMLDEYFKFIECNKKLYRTCVNKLKNGSLMDLEKDCFFLKDNEHHNIGYYSNFSNNDERIMLCNTVLKLILQKETEKKSVFSKNETLLLKAHIERQLDMEPRMYQCFNASKDDFINGIYESFVKIEEIVQRYPKEHVFKNSKILFDAMLFSLAYCYFIVPHFFKCNEMMDDLLIRKLPSRYAEKFSMESFNQNWCEFEIFFYLVSSIFFRSDLHTSFKRLVYEGRGATNKKFEYSFEFDTFSLNIEVKSLECDPFRRDKIDMFKMKDGELYYKNYFSAEDDNTLIPYDVICKATKLSSNLRQVKKNIKRINEKCISSADNINLGFIMINYGTSREEYISYLLNDKYGWLQKNTLDKIDGLIFFSMCTNTDLCMDNILQKDHIMLFTDHEEERYCKLFEKLRIHNYVKKGNKISKEIISIANEKWGIYEGIKYNSCVSIQRKCHNEEWKEDYDAYIEHMSNIELLEELR